MQASDGIEALALQRDLRQARPAVPVFPPRETRPDMMADAETLVPLNRLGMSPALPACSAACA